MLIRNKFVFLRPLERIALHSSVLIIEGISGSGKDAFQMYLKNISRAAMYTIIPKVRYCSRGINCKLGAFSNCELSL